MGVMEEAGSPEGGYWRSPSECQTRVVALELREGLDSDSVFVFFFLRKETDLGML